MLDLALVALLLMPRCAAAQRVSVEVNSPVETSALLESNGDGASQGGTLMGSLRDVRGEPVARGVVALLVRSDKGWDPTGQARTDVGGHFELPYTTPGTYILHARAEGIGAVQVRELALDPTRPSTHLELVLPAHRPHVGRVLDPVGDPVAGLRLVLLPTRAPRFPLVEDLIDVERAGRLVAQQVRTGQEGEFALTGLRAGAYAVYAKWHTFRADVHGEAVSELGEPLGEVVVGVDAPEPTLRVAQRRIELRMGDFNGRVVVPRTGRHGVFVEDRRLAFHRLRDGQVDPFFYGGRGLVVGDRVVFPVDEAGTYLIAWEEPGRTVPEVRVVLPEDSYSASVRLAVGEPVVPATLRARAFAPDGQPVTIGDFFVLQQHSRRSVVDSVVRFSRSSINHRDPEWEVELAPGDYLLRADARRRTGCRLILPKPRPAYRTVEQPFSIRPGELLELDVVLGEAGHLDFIGHLSAADRPVSDDPLAIFEAMRDLRPGHRERQRECSGVPRLESTNGVVLTGLEFEVYFDYARWVAPGYDARCQTPIPPGHWNLIVERAGEIIEQRAIVIEVGRVTTLRW